MKYILKYIVKQKQNMEPISCYTKGILSREAANGCYELILFGYGEQYEQNNL